MKNSFNFDLLSIVTDWIRDSEGNLWFLGVKSYLLTEEGYDAKVNKPTVFDREMLNLNKIKRPAHINFARCLGRYKLSDISDNRISLKIFNKLRKQSLARESCDWLE